MNKNSRILILSVAVLLALAALVACGSADETLPPGATIPGMSISITDTTCPSVEIKPNDQITWTNEDAIEHHIRVEYSDGTPLVDLGALQPGDSASFTFLQAGSFEYTCSEDQAYTSIITVQP